MIKNAVSFIFQKATVQNRSVSAQFVQYKNSADIRFYIVQTAQTIKNNNILNNYVHVNISPACTFP